METSTDRILTTHVGSLPRPPDLFELLTDEDQGRLADPAALEARVAAAVRDIVARQVDTGIDIVSDGPRRGQRLTRYLCGEGAGDHGKNSETQQQDSETQGPRRGPPVSVFTRRFCHSHTWSLSIVHLISTDPMHHGRQSTGGRNAAGW